MKLTIVFAFILIAFASGVYGDDALPTIDTYEFQWTVCKSDEAELKVEKTQDTITIEMRGSSSSNSITVSPKDAPAIGDVLKTTDDHWKAMKNSDKEISETVDTGKYKITFHNDPKYGFVVWIKDSTNDFSSLAIFKREVAKAFTPFLGIAPKLAALVDKKIQP